MSSSKPFLFCFGCNQYKPAMRSCGALKRFQSPCHVLGRVTGVRVPDADPRLNIRIAPAMTAAGIRLMESDGSTP